MEKNLFINARKLGVLTDRTRMALLEEDIAKTTGAYHAWLVKDTV
jgi:type I restriction enzyme M protein